MFDFYSMERRAAEALRPPTRQERELLNFLAEEQEAKDRKTARPVRRRIASAIVGLGLKLDPEALAINRRRVAMEAVNVRD